MRKTFAVMESTYRLIQTPWKKTPGLFVLRVVSDEERSVTLVSYLIGALSPVNHKGLHQGWWLRKISNVQMFRKKQFILGI